MFPPTNLAESVDLVQRYRPIHDLIPAHWAQGDVIANGTRQHFYRTGGNKPPLLLLHGFMDSALTWLRAARILEKDYDVIMPDTRGHGYSERLAGDYSPELLSQDAAAFLRALNLAQVRVIGHSQGGATGIFLTAQHSELVRALVVEGWSDQVRGDLSASPGYQQWLDAYIAWFHALRTQTHSERMVAGLSQLMPNAPVPREDDYVAWIESCVNLDLDLVGQGAAMWASAEQNVQNMRAALQKISQPVLILKSDAFPKSGASVVTTEPSDQANIKILHFENAGHLIHREQLDEYIAAVNTFFRDS